ncbi:hypothetical protein KSF78_0009636 [Schistosoma japonicum]|nr:hypothetical protein KSF78_0009636 [Schistosoma japonicum]
MRHIGVRRCPSCDYFNFDSNESHMQQFFRSLTCSIETLVDSDSDSIGVGHCPSCDHFIIDTDYNICSSFSLAHLVETLLDIDSDSIVVKRCPSCDYFF